MYVRFYDYLVNVGEYETALRLSLLTAVNKASQSMAVKEISQSTDPWGM